MKIAYFYENVEISKKKYAYFTTVVFLLHRN